ncbi:MAG TPA: hypothetical protein VGE07_14385 [Herpetosiphonaceae bacterium]
MATGTLAGRRSAAERPARAERDGAAARADGWRLAAAAAVLLALASFVLGTAWDIQWHTAVGRDRALTWPHVLMLGGIIVSGLASLALVLFDTWRFHRGGPVSASNSSRIAWFFRAPAGFAAAGVGALSAAIAFPLDDYWHTLYGIDVTLWAPFHVMIVGGVVLSGAGALYGLAAEANRAGGRRLLAQGLVAALAGATFASLLLLIGQANTEEGLVQIGGYAFVLYPLLLGFAAAALLFGVTRATPLPGAATIAVLTLLALRWASRYFVPWATDLVVTAEGLAYRSNPPITVIAAVAYPGWIILSALLTDAAAWWERRQAARRPWLLPLAAGAGALLSTLLDQPWLWTMRTYYFPDLDGAAMYLNALPWTLAAIGIGLAAGAALGRGLAAVKR